MNMLSVGDRVKLVSRFYNVQGTITEVQRPLVIQGSMYVSPKYKVVWDDNDISGWLSPTELTLIQAVTNE